ncbi:MAG TPA: phosphatase PAP2 family protein [Bryobacteraceae bacterium]
MLSENLFFLSALICATVVFICSAKRWEIIMAALLGLASGLIFRIPSNFLPTQVMLWLSWWGAGGFIVTTFGIYRTPAGRSSRMRLIRRMAFAPLAALLGSLFVTICAQMTPLTLDRYLYVADGSFGFQPGFACRAFLMSHEWLRLTTGFAYVNLPLLAMLLYLLVGRWNPVDATRVVRLLSAVGLIGYILYYFFPAAGAEVVLGAKFPFHPPDVASMTLAPIPVAFAPRNFMPSLHTAWCLAIYWPARQLSKIWRTILLGIVALTLVYTLSCHYLVDMIAAIPFTLAMYALVENRLPWGHSARRLALCAGAGCFAAWLFVLRFGTALLLVSPVVSWMAAALTVALCWRCLYAEPVVAESLSDVREGNLEFSSPLLT